jgi:hypothetical protein
MLLKVCSHFLKMTGQRSVLKMAGKMQTDCEIMVRVHQQINPMRNVLYSLPNVLEFSKVH